MSVHDRILLVDDESAIVEAPANTKKRSPCVGHKQCAAPKMDRRLFLHSLCRDDLMILLTKVGEVLEWVLALYGGVDDLTPNPSNPAKWLLESGPFYKGRIGNIITFSRLEGYICRFGVRPPLTSAGAPWRAATSGFSSVAGERSPLILEPLFLNSV